MYNEFLGVFIEEEFDYAHFIPKHPKCYPLHGHTAKIKIELIGNKKDFGMILDFSEIKKIVRNILSNYDHKLIVSKKYIKEIKEGKVKIITKELNLQLSLKDVYIIEDEVTTENIVEDICVRMLNMLPIHIKEINVLIYEGARKGAFKKRKRK